MNYYQLTAGNRAGQIVRQDGRRHYRFVFGSYQWERTTLFQTYLTEGTALSGQYCSISEEDAQRLLTENGRHLALLLKKANTLAEQAHAGQVDKAGVPYIEHPRAVADSLADWEEKIVALLHDVCEDTPWTVQLLQKEGFPPYICHSIDLLTRKEGVPYEEYLRGVRQDRLARNVKLMDLSHNMELDRIPQPTDADRERVKKYKKARQYLYGDIPTFSDEVDTEPAVKVLIPSENIYKQVYPLALGGRKVPHGLSNPVLRQRNGKLCMAFFVYTYTRHELQQGAIRRPVSWIIADLENGRLLEDISCDKEDFSEAPKDTQYSTEKPTDNLPADFFLQTYAILDAVRQEYIMTGNLNRDTYREYLQKILQAVPLAYHRFYQDLSLEAS